MIKRAIVRMKTLLISNDKVKAITYLAKQNEKKILSSLGINTGNNGAIKGICPIHGGDNESAFSYDFNKKVWSCFTHHCEKDHGNDIVGFIQGVTGLNFIDTIRWLAKFFDVKIGGDYDLDQDSQINKIKDLIDTESFIKRHSPSEENDILEEDMLDQLIPNYSYFKERGFTAETCKFFECGIMGAANVPVKYQRAFIPIRDIDGNLIGLTGRSLYEECPKCKVWHPDYFRECPEFKGAFSKWRHFPEGFRKSLTLFNIHNAKEEIARTGKAFLTEGPLDIMAFHQFGVKNSVATFGTSITFEQMLLLSKLGCVELYLLYDNDEAGQKAAVSSDNSVYSVTKNVFNTYNIELPQGKDPGNILQSEFDLYIKKYI